MNDLVLELGPLGVFLLMVPESTCIPIPSEVTLMCAGFAVKSRLMPFWLAVVAATAGNLVGSLIAYAIGRAGSRREIGPRASRAFAGCNRLFDRHGTRAGFVLLGVLAGAGWEQLSGTVGTLLLALTAVAVATWLLLQQRGSRAAR